MNAIFDPVSVQSEELRFAFGDCWLGAVLVATSPTGVASILIGDDPVKLRRELGAAFPQARLAEDSEGLEEIIRAVSDFLEAPGRGLDLPLDIRGDAVQQAVWMALRATPQR